MWLKIFRGKHVICEVVTNNGKLQIAHWFVYDEKQAIKTSKIKNKTKKKKKKAHAKNIALLYINRLRMLFV